MLGTVPLSDAQHVARAPRAPRKAIPDGALAPQATQPAPRNVPAPPRPHSFVIERTAPAATDIPAARRENMPRARSFLAPLLALFALLNVGDLASTYLGLYNGMREGNPLMGALLAQYGFGALILYKLLVIAAVTGGIVFLHTFHRRVASVTVWVCNSLVLLVVVINVAQYLAIR
ncbi:MAG TPA: DUF5658 family protein [Ktedonobacterales bacterium]|nr:DUF5658 family protein [Ktedonobacterales bacterium]